VKSFKFFFFASLILASAIYVFLFYSEALQRDSSAYLYIGSQISIGKIPYIDLFDHKGPILYLINTMPFLFGNSWTLIYLIEGAMLGITTLIIFKISRNIINDTYGYLIASAYMLSFLTVFKGGNLPETYTLFILSISYFFILYNINFEEKQNLNTLKYLFFWLGVAIGLIALIKISNILGILFLSIFFAFDRRGVSKKFIFLIMLGVIAVIFPVMIWLEINSAFQEFINQYLLFNFSYIDNEDLKSRFINSSALIIYFIALPVNILLIFFLCSLILRKTNINLGKWFLVFFGVFSIDFLSQLISGKGFAQYLLITIPSSLILICLIIINNDSAKINSELKMGRIQILFSAIIILSSYRIAEDLKKFSTYSIYNEDRVAQIEYLKNYNSIDRIAVNASESWLYLQASKISSSKYFSNLGPANNFLYSRDEYIDSIEGDRTSIIVTHLCNQDLNPNFICHEPLNAVLEESYKKDLVIDNLEFWKLR
jgi:hypothetical protein